MQATNKFFSSALLCLSLVGCGGGGSGSTPGPNSAPLPAPMPVLASTTTLIRTNPGVAVTWADRSTATGGSGATTAGVECLKAETYHLHTHLTIIKGGITQRIPKDVGLTGCAYELHTHDSSGIIHVETSIEKKFTLGQFFAVWGQPLSKENVAGLGGSPVRVFIEDAGLLEEYTGDPNAIELKQKRSVYIILGDVPPYLPKHAWPDDL